MSKGTSRRYRKAHDRRVWVFSQLNHDLQPEQIARILVAASLEQAQREADARRATEPELEGDEESEEVEGEKGIQS
jgi:dihydrofolate reductase